jgi:hypothetical protein
MGALSRISRWGVRFSLGASFRLAFPTSILSLPKDAVSGPKWPFFKPSPFDKLRVTTLWAAPLDFTGLYCHHLQMRIIETCHRHVDVLYCK